MNFRRLSQTARLWMIPGAVKRAEYLRKHDIFAFFGEKCSWMDRKIPLYAKLIKVGNNVHFASRITFLTHDVAHMMINRMDGGKKGIKEKIGCIEIGNNVSPDGEEVGRKVQENSWDAFYKCRQSNIKLSRD